MDDFDKTLELDGRWRNWNNW